MQSVQMKTSVKSVALAASLQEHVPNDDCRRLLSEPLSRDAGFSCREGDRWLVSHSCICRYSSVVELDPWVRRRAIMPLSNPYPLSIPELESATYKFTVFRDCVPLS